MSIMVKDISGAEHSIASSGRTNAALTTGIIGTALGGLGLLGGGSLLGGGNTTVAERLMGEECLISKDQFYQTLISQINTQADRDIATERRFAGVEAAIAVNTTANSYQNAAVDTRFNSENTINNLILNLAICEATKNVVRGQTYLSPSTLADSFIAPTRVIDSHEAREYLPGRRAYGGYPNAFVNDCAPCAPCAPCGQW